ncbi:unnamed protein product [Polarella glacialis]|uniref:Uncharacterized protein n=1 Tax=Polarella glacialis TaxID=89957 RepID=A0A813HAE3_POLGL|nr:unnamed protein product [Polarella glacialis]
MSPIKEVLKFAMHFFRFKSSSTQNPVLSATTCTAGSWSLQETSMGGNCWLPGQTSLATQPVLRDIMPMYSSSPQASAERQDKLGRQLHHNGSGASLNQRNTAVTALVS